MSLYEAYLDKPVRELVAKIFTQMECIQKLQEGNKVLREAVVYALGDISDSIVFDANTEKVMLDALAKADEIMGEKR